MTLTPDHADELEARAIELMVSHGVRHPVVLLRKLKDIDGFCGSCQYKRKRRTGEPINVPTTLSSIDDIVRTPQRDGDAGDLDVRHRHVDRVLYALWLAVNNGLTDEDLEHVTGIIRDSAKGCRANLMKGGWVVASGVKRLSVQARPMEVWLLSPPARDLLDAKWGPVMISNIKRRRWKRKRGP